MGFFDRRTPEQKHELRQARAQHKQEMRGRGDDSYERERQRLESLRHEQDRQERERQLDMRDGRRDFRL